MLDMLVNPLHLQRCLDKVREIVDQYQLSHIGADDPCRSVGNLKATVETYLDCRIQVLAMPLAAKENVVHGMFIMKGSNSFDICYVSDLEHDWRRFVVCKELFHILLDQESYRDMDILEHVLALTTYFPQDDSKPRASVVAEFLAEVAAMEFLLPRVARLQVLKDSIALATVSSRYHVPLLFVERYLSESWMANLDPATISAV